MIELSSQKAQILIKTDGLHECIISNYLCFLAINVRFQPKVCYGCHDMTLKLMNFDSFAIVTV